MILAVLMIVDLRVIQLFHFTFESLNKYSS